MSLVPQQTKSKVWWSRSGRKQFASYLDFFLGAQAEHYPLDPDDVVHVSQDDEATFRDAVDSWEPEELPEELQSSELTGKEDNQEKEVNELLSDISELLETLHSQQQIRHSSLHAASRSQAPTAKEQKVDHKAAIIPSEAEVDVYNLLKSQLTLIISNLPPFAVARLNGDRLQSLTSVAKLSHTEATPKAQWKKLTFVFGLRP